MEDNEKSREQLILELEKLRRENLKNSKNVHKSISSDPISSAMSSNDEWQLTFDAIPDLIALIDNDFRIRKMNKAMAELLGVNAQEIVGTHCYSLIHGTHQPPTSCPHAKLIQDKKSHIEEFYEKKLNKNIIVSVTPIFDDDGHVIGSVHVVHDDTKRKKAEEALKKSENRYRSLFENMLEGFAYCKMLFNEEGNPVDWIYLDVNSAFENLTGLKNIVGKRVLEAIPNIKELEPTLFEIYGRVTLTGKPERIETYFKPLEIWLNISVFSPEKEHFVAVFENITKRKKIELSLKESEKKFREVFNNANDAIFLHKFNEMKPSNFLEVNKVACDVLGYTQEELLQMSPMDIDSPETTEKTPKVMEKILKKGKITFEAVHISKKGEMLPVEISAHVFAMDGEKYIISVARNITERKAAEEALKVSEENLNLILNSAAEAIYGIDTKGLCTFCNPTCIQLLGYQKAEQLLGKNMHNLIHHSHPDGSLYDIEECPIFQAFRTGDYVHVDDEVFWRADGTSFSVEYWSYPQIKDDEIVGAVVTFLDITERKLAEKQIKQSLEEKEMLLKEIHHRVKNNLMIISSLLNLQSRYIKDKESQEIFKESQNRARSMALIHQRLYQSTDLKNIDFKEYITTLSNDLYRTYVNDPSRVSLKLNIEDFNIDINAAIPLGLILNELITNSMKHAFPNEEEGTINIDFGKKGDKLVLIVSDDGVGFPEDLDYHNTDSLGLQLVTSLTSQISGELELDRTEGTSFKITFAEPEIS